MSWRSPPPTTRVVLIRHGEAQAAIDNIVAGHNACTGLSALGRRQAEALRDRLSTTGELADATVLYSSVLPRAIETAEIIAPALDGLDGVSVKQDCDLCELHTGDVADGLTWAEAQERFPWPGDNNPDVEWAPGGETLSRFKKRVETSVRRLATEHEGSTVVAACHGGIIAWSMIQLIGRTGPVNFNPTNTSITEWHVTGDDWTLHRYNDAAHLNRVG